MPKDAADTGFLKTGRQCPSCGLPASIFQHESEAECIRALKANIVALNKRVSILERDREILESQVEAVRGP